jgi:hypothetical protein
MMKTSRGAHFLGHRIAQRFAHGRRHHFGAFGNVRIGGAGAWRPALRAPMRRGFRFLPSPGRRGWAASAPRSAEPMSEALSPSSSSTAMTALTLTRLGAGGNQDLADHALVDGLDFHRRLVGFDFGDHVAGGNDCRLRS